MGENRTGGEHDGAWLERGAHAEVGTDTDKLIEV